MERAAFDAWGRRMNPSGTTDPGSQLNPANGDRGFTGHEHLDEIGLVHMNGRIYDPRLGRFFSPDPVMQAEELLQNYNRYSNVLNNPLRYTDPDGEWWQVVAFIIGAALQASNNQNIKMVGQVMMMAALSMPGGIVEAGLGTNTALSCGLPSTFNAGGIGSAALSAGASSLISSGGNVGEAAKVAAFAAAFNVVGVQDWDTLSAERLTAHAVLGCAQSATSGGQCGPGAMAAVAGKVGSAGLDRLDAPMPIGLAGTAAIGGTASVIGGGKFANGALTASFGYLFNKLTADARGRAALDRLRSGSPTAAQLIAKLEAVEEVWTLSVDESSKAFAQTNGYARTIVINPTAIDRVEFQAAVGQWFKRSLDVTVGHELKHAVDIQKLGVQNALFPLTYDRAIDFVNKIARELDPKAPLRQVNHRCCYRVVP